MFGMLDCRAHRLLLIWLWHANHWIHQPSMFFWHRLYCLLSTVSYVETWLIQIILSVCCSFWTAA